MSCYQSFASQQTVVVDGASAVTAICIKKTNICDYKIRASVYMARAQGV
jgi:hypothetical protein